MDTGKNEKMPETERILKQNNYTLLLICLPSYFFQQQSFLRHICPTAVGIRNMLLFMSGFSGTHVFIHLENDVTPSFANDVTPSFANDVTLSFANDVTLTFANYVTLSFANDVTLSFANDVTLSLADYAVIHSFTNYVVTRRIASEWRITVFEAMW